MSKITSPRLARGRPQNPAARRERRRLILDAARASFVESGFASAPMSKIAEAAGVSVANIYQYFSCKEELIHQLVCDGFDLEIEKIRQMALTEFKKSRLHEFMQVQFSDEDHLNAVKLRYEALAEATRNPAISQLMIAAENSAMAEISNVLKKSKSNGDLSPDLDVDAASRNILFSHAGVAARLAIAPEMGPDLAGQFADLVDQVVNFTLPKRSSKAL